MLTIVFATMSEANIKKRAKQAEEIVNLLKKSRGVDKTVLATNIVAFPDDDIEKLQTLLTEVIEVGEDDAEEVCFISNIICE